MKNYAPTLPPSSGLVAPQLNPSNTDTEISPQRG